MKRTLSLLACLFLLTALSACGGANTGNKADIKPVIGLSMHNQTAAWAVQFKDSFLEAAAAKGIEVKWTDANGVAATQVNNIDDLMIQGISVLVVVPTDYSALGQALRQAHDAGIPIVNADSKVAAEDQALVTSFVTADCYSGGVLAGEYLAELFPKGGKIGTLNYPQISSIADRFNGMQDAFDKLGRKDFVVVEKIVTDLNAVATYTEDMLMANPDIEAFVCLNDSTAPSCYGACAQLGYPNIAVIGFDGDPTAKKSIANGEMTATLVYSPVDISTMAFDAAYKILNGETPEKDIQVPMWMISPQNIKDMDLNNWE